MKNWTAFLFGFTVCTVISLVSPYTFANWQWWAAIVVIGVVGQLHTKMRVRGLIKGIREIKI